jgi:integrase
MIDHGKIVKRTWKWNGKRRVAYLFDIEVDGKRVRHQFSSKQEAKDELDKFRDGIKNPKPVVAALAAPVTFGSLVDKFLAQKSRAKTADEFERVAKILKLEFGADSPIASITAERISDYKAERLKVQRGDKGLTAAGINRPLGLLRTMLRQALKWKMIAELPEIEFEKENPGVIRWLTREEAHRLLEACRQSRNPTLIDLVEFALFTGVRRGEALALTWERVDRSRGVITLVETKNGLPREIKLSAPSDAVLARRWTPGATGFVFGSQNWNTFRQSWARALRVAKVANFRFHDLRHTTASWAVQSGRSLLEVKELLGHSDITITLRYAHLAPNHQVATVNAVADFFYGAARRAAPAVPMEVPVA